MISFYAGRVFASVVLLIGIFTLGTSKLYASGDACVTCNNITNAGSIGYDQSGCSP
ncbi:MAG: hypothetical protein JNM00_01840, partial [Flavobacteriales bacterium]|nr:hypothetical protein [Flavobacteriales bacterium]